MTRGLSVTRGLGGTRRLGGTRGSGATGGLGMTRGLSVTRGLGGTRGSGATGGLGAPRGRSATRRLSASATCCYQGRRPVPAARAPSASASCCYLHGRARSSFLRAVGGSVRVPGSRGQPGPYSWRQGSWAKRGKRQPSPCETPHFRPVFPARDPGVFVIVGHPRQMEPFLTHDHG